MKLLRHSYSTNGVRPSDPPKIKEELAAAGIPVRKVW